MDCSGGHSGGEVILVSACLLGLPTRYDGGHCRSAEVVALAGRHCLVPVCPEQLGGLSTPRPPSEIEHGDGSDVLDGRARVLSTEGTNVTGNFVRGARAAAEIAETCGATRAILKEGSPSCGVSRIMRAEQAVEGEGVAAALLRRKGLKVDGIA